MRSRDDEQRVQSGEILINCAWSKGCCLAARCLKGPKALLSAVALAATAISRLLKPLGLDIKSELGYTKTYHHTTKLIIC